MKIYLILALAFCISCCSSVKEQKTTKTEPQLLKDVETLSSDTYEGRKTGTKGNEMAKTYIINRFKELGLKSFPNHLNYIQNFNVSSKKSTISGKNIIGYISGKSDNVIVISAHYDHVGVINNEIYNGADDNASGVAALLKYAAYFSKHKPNNTLIFAAFDAEEMGLQGAKAFVDNPPVNLSKVKINLNMDMISHNDKGELYACGTFKYPELKKYCIITNPDIKILFGHDDPKQGHDDWTNQSDQGAFNAKNIPFLYFGVEDHKDYHKESDEYTNINKTFFVDAANAILEIINNIDKERDIQSIFKAQQRMKKQS